MRSSTRLCSALAAAALLAGCGGGGGGSSHALPSAGSPLNSSSFAATTTFAYGKSILKTATPAGPATLGTMKVDVMMHLPNVAALDLYAQQVGNPQSPLYRHFLTPDQIGSQFGANPTAYQAAIKYFTSYGLSVTGWKQRTLLRVVGPQAAMEKAFGTTFVLYNGPKGTFFGPSSSPHFATPLAVDNVSHLIYGKFFNKRQSIQIPPHGETPAFDGGYPAPQIAAAFDYTGAYNSGYTGTGITIGVIGTGPIDPADYAAYKAEYSTGATNNITQVDVGSAAAIQAGSSATATPPPVTAPCNGALPACNPEDGEAQIDTQQTAALAPSANILFYLAYVPNETCNGTCGPYGPELGISEVDDEVQQALNDNVADILSISYGIAEEYSEYVGSDDITYNPNAVEPVQFATAEAQGIAVFASSGDAGAQGCARPYYGPEPGAVTSADQNCVSAPAVDVNVTSVGGITTPVDESGRAVGPYTAWGIQTYLGYGATGGGVSQTVPLPAWQYGTNITPGHRNQPDMALEGDPQTGVAVAQNISFGGGFYAYGGTSVAAPESAAMWALVLDACNRTPACTAKGTQTAKYRMGNAGPALYKIYNNATNYADTFLDITSGNNGVVPCLVNPSQVGACPNPQPTPDPGFNAGVGYDHLTGIGVPFARNLIKQVVGV
jgi:kumamolisin